MPDLHAITAVAVGAILSVLSLLHFFWCLDGVKGSSAVLPEVDGRPLFVPSRFASAAVGVLLAAATLVVLGQGGWLGNPLSFGWLRTLTGAIGALFLLRSIGDFRFVGFFKRVRGTRFAQWDTRLFSPLCLALGSATVWLACATSASPARALEHWTEPVTGIELVSIAAGEFTMGSPPEEAGREPQEVQHRVRLSRPFLIGRTEVTQGLWQRVMGSNPSHFTVCGPNCPVERVSAADIDRFLDRLAQLTGHRFRLPTEAEWEYACRAGTTTPFATGRELSTEQANFDARDPSGSSAESPPAGATMPVASYSPNAWGLYDFRGNVWEWTADRHCDYAQMAATDPSGNCASPLRVIRGGSWHYGADSARCALRYTHDPADSGFSLGFRLVRDTAPR